MPEEEEDRAKRVQREIFLRSFAPAKPSAAAARQLAQVISDGYFPAGSVLYREGEEPTEIFWIVSGEVRCEKEGEEPWIFRAGDAIGIFDVNLERPRARTAIAVTDVTVMVLRAEDLIEVQEDNFEFTRQLLWQLAQRLHDICLSLAPSGGFPVPAFDDWELAEGLEMNLVERIVVLKDSPTFEQASVQSLVRLANQFDVLRLSRDDVVFAPGTARKQVFVVACGQVSVARQKAPVIEATFGRGSLVCGYAALGEIELEYKAWVRSPQAIVLRVAEDDLLDVMEDHHDVVRSVMRGMTGERERLMVERGRLRLDPVAIPDPV